MKNTHWSGTLSGVLLRPSTIGEPMAADITHTNTIVSHIRRLFLCLAYLIGCVTAIYLQQQKKLELTLIPKSLMFTASFRHIFLIQWQVYSDRILRDTKSLLLDGPYSVHLVLKVWKLRDFLSSLNTEGFLLFILSFNKKVTIIHPQVMPTWQNNLIHNSLIWFNCTLLTVLFNIIVRSKKQTISR